MIKIRVTPSQLEKGKITEVRYSRSKSIKDYLEGIDLTGQKVIVSGKVIKDLNKKPKNGDQIIVCPDVKAPVIGAIVGAVVAWAALHPIAAVLTFVMIGFAIYSAVTAKSRMPNFGTVGDGLDASSPTYGWEGIRTIQEVGTPVPVVYGRHRVGGNIINQYVSTDGDKQYLNLLIALCEGEIEDISTIKINGNPIENYTGISTYLRYGTNSQAVIQHFEDLHNDYPISIPLVKNDAYIYTTIDNDIETFEINLSLPNGLFYTDSSSGSIYAWSVTYKVEYKLHADSTWINLGNTTISAKSRTALRRVFRKEGLTAGQYDIRITRTSDNGDFYHTGDLYLSSIDEIKTDDLSYPNTALLGIRALATEQLSGSTPNITSLVEGRLISAPNVLYEDGGAAVAWEDYYYDPDTSSFKLLADDTVLFWGGDYIEQFCANPIWCLKDLQLNTRYGLGEYIDMAQLDETKLLEMALYCEGKVPNGEDGYEKRFRLDVVIDSRAKALDILTQICAAFRAFAFYSDGKIQFKIDAPEEVTQLFGMGNIIAGSFQQGWKSIKEVPNVIEVIYMDQDLDYQQEQIAVIDETALAAGDPIRKKQLRIFTTKTSYAIREGRYALWLAKYINRSVSFRAGIEAVACQAGDVIVISHDVPQWSFSGRTKEGSTTSLIKLDRTITIEDNKTYMIGIRHADDTLETGIVTDSPGYYTEVNISEAFQAAPAEGDVYIFGDTETISKTFRVIGIKREGAGEVQITAIEYNESVYDDSAVVLPTNNYSSLSNSIPNVLGLTLTERIVKMSDGTIEDVIDVWFTRPDLSSYYLKRYAKAKIYISEDNGVSWTYRGETTGTHFAIQGDIYDLKTYIVAVVSVSDKGEENSIEDSAQETITVLGKTAPPDDITGFDVCQEGNLLKFVWEANDDADLARYIIKKGNDWATGQTIAEKVDTTDFMYPVGEVGLQTFMIKAVDTSGNESANPTYDTLTVIPPPEMNFINNFDLWSVPLDYKLSDLERVWANFHDKDFNRIALALRTADTWETREAEGLTWEAQEIAGGLMLDEEFLSAGSFEMVTPYDLQTIFNFKIVVDADYAQGTNCTVTIQISTSEDGITYTAFEDIDADKSYQARYLKFKVLISTTNTAYNAYLFDTLIYINAPTVKVSWGKDIVIPIAGKSVLFDAGFTLPPRVIANIVNGVVGVIKISNKTKDGMVIEALNLSGENIGTAEVDYDARGYVWIIGFILNSLILGGLLACIL